MSADFVQKLHQELLSSSLIPAPRFHKQLSWILGAVTVGVGSAVTGIALYLNYRVYQRGHRLIAAH